MNNIENISRDSLIYGIGSGLKKFIGFFLLPIYTRAISQSDYGILDILSVTMILSSALLGFGLNMGIGRYFFEMKTKEEKGEFLFTILSFRIFTFIIILFLLPFSKYFAQLLLFSDEKYFLIVITLLIIPISLLNTDQEVIIRYNRKPWQFNILVLVKALGNIILGILFVIIYELGIIGALYAQIFSSIIVLLIAVVFFNRNIYSYKFSTYWFKKILKFSFPFTVAGVSSWLLYSGNRIIVSSFDGFNSVALIAVAYTITQPLSLINNAINQSAPVIIMKAFSNEKSDDKLETKKLIANLWEKYLIIAVFLCLIISIFATNIITLVSTSSYKNGAILIPLFAFSSILTFSPELIGWGPIFKERTRSIATVFILASIVNIFLSYFLLGYWGITGIGIAFFIACFVYFSIFYRVSQSLFFINHKIFKITSLFFCSFFISFIIPFSEVTYDLIMPSIIKISLVLGAFYFIVKLEFVTKEQIIKGIQLLRKLFYAKNI